ncbi:hypothetical protein LF1_31550 [Rubripirellula obstinata]|uniref:Uncharacterized protein n=1 Tax=Rubripirellula obstinata TaxID=406547 RepID=A0A5B1CL47_9BACT|nr:hypothetical protein LF1_31550 [Rubripirellula obstinata]
MISSRSTSRRSTSHRSKIRRSTIRRGQARKRQRNYYRQLPEILRADNEAAIFQAIPPERREEFWSRKKRVRSFSRVGIAPRVWASTTRGAMPTRLNNLETLHGVGFRPAGTIHERSDRGAINDCLHLSARPLLGEAGRFTSLAKRNGAISLLPAKRQTTSQPLR